MTNLKNAITLQSLCMVLTFNVMERLSLGNKGHYEHLPKKTKATVIAIYLIQGGNQTHPTPAARQLLQLIKVNRCTSNERFKIRLGSCFTVIISPLYYC